MLKYSKLFSQKGFSASLIEEELIMWGQVRKLGKLGEKGG